MGALGIPAFRYGSGAESLQALRRRLGYFQHGMLPRPYAAVVVSRDGPEAAPHRLPFVAGVHPASGPPSIDAALGLCCVGDAPWIVNFNVPLLTRDAAAAKTIARAVRALRRPAGCGVAGAAARRGLL